jgi:cytosine/adenosine deaminase-related metal-dependent hydrolase
MVELLSVNPARILRVPGGTLAEGAPADITVLAPDLTVTVDARAAVEVEEHAVRRLDAARRRRRHDRRRPDRLRERRVPGAAGPEPA